MPQQSFAHRTAAWNFILCDSANMSNTDIFKEYLTRAGEEYKELKTQLEELQLRLEVKRHRLLEIQGGSALNYVKGENARLEAEKPKLEEMERMVMWRMDRWLEIIQECVKALREAACRN